MTFAFSLQIVPPVLPLVIKDFNLTHAEAGLIMSLFATPMIFLSIPAGFLADRHGARKVGLVAFTLTIIGTLLVVLSTSYPLLLVGRALTGVGAFTLIMIAPQLISQWFTGRELGMAIGIFNTGMPMGSIISLFAMGSIGQTFGWRVPPLISGAIALLSMIIFAVLTKQASPTVNATRAEASGRIRIADVGLPIWLVGLAWLLFNAGTIPFMSFAPDYFRSVGYSVELAGLLAGSIMWGSLLVAPAVGVLLDRGLNNVLPIACGGVFIAVALVLVPSMPSQAIPPLILLAIGNGLVPAAIFAFPPRLLDARMMGLGYGILSSLLNVGIFTGPLVAGLARDQSGSYTASFWVMAVLALLVSVSILPMLRLMKPRTGIESSPVT